MAMTPLTSLALLVILSSTLCATKASLGKKLLSHSVLLEHFKPTVADFAKSLTKVVNGSDGLEAKLNDVINQDLAAQLDQLIVMRNGSLVPNNLEVCCHCVTCLETCSACGQTCCRKGDLGCICRDCGNSVELKFGSIGTDGSSEIQRWAESSKQILRRDVTQVMARHGAANERCCTCNICRSFETRCESPFSCCTVGEGCLCRTCQSAHIDLVADFVGNPVTLTPETMNSVTQVNAIIDRLLLLLNYP